ncbi:MAG: creatininase family protein [Ruminococcaceae bacterium]|nr:creatininase family protein [Oscillospiraceae bacterium]
MVSRKGKFMISYNNTAKEVKESGVDMAILPFGSVEQHSSHLPIGTDVMLAEDIARGIAERINALLLPAIPISTCYEHKGTKGSVCMRPITFYQMLQDIVLCLRDQGIKKVAVVLGHGGIFIAAPAIRELNALYDDLQVVLVQSESGKGNRRSLLENTEPEIHAGESETSLMLYLHEELVNKELMMQNDYTPEYPQNMLNHVPLTRISGTGAWGKSSLATKEKGKAIYECIVKNSVEYIERALSVCPKEKW